MFSAYTGESFQKWKSYLITIGVLTIGGVCVYVFLVPALRKNTGPGMHVIPSKGSDAKIEFDPVSPKVTFSAAPYPGEGGGVDQSSSKVPSDYSGQSGTDIAVDIAGAVSSPGFYILPSTSRVADLIKYAGGLQPRASYTWVAAKLNLAKKLSDAEKLYIPWDYEMPAAVSDSNPLTYCTEGKESGKSSGVVVNNNQEQFSSNDTITSGAQKININNCSLGELDSLPGIGTAYANKIVSNRPYLSAEELKTKSGVPEKIIANIEALLSY